MCGCSLSVLSKGSAGAYANQLDYASFKNDDARTMFQFYYCVSPTKFQKTFKDKYNLDVNGKSDVEAIAKMHEQKIDINNFKENFLDVAKKIDFTQDELDNASCTTALVI